jgi:hypothetical protein
VGNICRREHPYIANFVQGKPWQEVAAAGTQQYKAAKPSITQRLFYKGDSAGLVLIPGRCCCWCCLHLLAILCAVR